MQRIGLISDIHGNAVAFEAVLRDLWKQKIDSVFVLGDLANRGSEPAKCISLVGSLNCPVIGGNGDEWIVRGYDEQDTLTPSHVRSISQLQNWSTDQAQAHLREREWTVSQLNESEIEYLRALVDVHQHRLVDDQFMLLCHAVPNDRMKLVFPDTANDVLYETYLAPFQGVRIAAYGHTHLPFIRFFSGAVVINTGTVGLPFDGSPMVSYAVVEIDGEAISASIRRVSYDVQLACQLLDRVNYPYPALIGDCLRTGVRPIHEIGGANE